MSKGKPDHFKALLIIWGIFAILPDSRFKAGYLVVATFSSLIIVVGWIGFISK
jgi:hypothetical protein